MYGNSRTIEFFVGLDDGIDLTAYSPDGYDKAVPLHGSATLRVDARVTDGSEITYKWSKETYDSDGNYEGYGEITNATGNSYTVKNVTGYTEYSCYVENQYGDGKWIDFNIYIDSGLSVETDSNDVAAELHGTATLRVNASVTDGSQISYRWEKEAYEKDGEIFFETIDGATENSYTVENITECVEYQCVVMDSYGNSKSETFLVHPDSGLCVEGNGQEYIDKTATPHGSVELTVNATVTDGSALKYSWERTYFGTDGKDIYSYAGYFAEDGDSYTAEDVAEYAEYTCTVTDQYGYSQSVAFRVHPETGLDVEAVDGTEKTVAYDGSVSLAVNASVTNGSDEKLVYEWSRYYKNDTYYVSKNFELIPGAAGNSCTIENVTVPQIIKCTVTDEYGYSKTVEFTISLDGSAITLTTQNTTVILSESSYTYDGEEKKPTVTVKDSDGNAINSDCYAVTYANNTEVGTATVTIRFKGEYTGTITKTFEITAPKQNDQNPTVTTPTTGDDKNNTGTTNTDTASGTTGGDTTTGQGTGTTGTDTSAGTTGTDTTTPTTGSNTTTGTTTDTPQTTEKKELSTQNTTVKLSKSSYTYDGKAKKPTVTVKDSNGNTIDSKYYTVTYKNNKKVGKATVTITFKDSYTGTITATFKINPKTTSLKKVTSAKTKTVKVTWKKQATQTTGYEVQYSTNSKFTKKTTKTVTVKSAKTTSTIIKKLAAKKKYYVRIRTYKTVDGKKYYSDWSKALSVKTK
jgi:hypothetical protein